AEIAKKPAPVVKPDERLAEGWVITAIDEAWSFSTMVAAKLAFEVLEQVAKDLGLQPNSRAANSLALFVLSRVGDFKIHEVHQKAGLRRDADVQFIRSVIENPAPYEAALR